MKLDDPENPWPALPLAEWEATRATLHMWTQIVGKVRLALSPHMNHWWQVPLYVSARGLNTTTIPHTSGPFEMEFDFGASRLEIRKCGQPAVFVPLYPRSVADFYRETMAALAGSGIEVKIWPTPVEIADPIPFAEDDQHAAYDPEYVRRFHRILWQADAVLKEFRGRFIGKASPVHFFWGSFDLAATRFSGRPAPDRPGADRITREAYSHECSEGRFLARRRSGYGTAFYSYAAPEPAALRPGPFRRRQLIITADLGEFILMYDDVRELFVTRTAV